MSRCPTATKLPVGRVVSPRGRSRIRLDILGQITVSESRNRFVEIAGNRKNLRDGLTKQTQGLGVW